MHCICFQTFKPVSQSSEIWCTARLKIYSQWKLCKPLMLGAVQLLQQSNIVYARLAIYTMTYSRFIYLSLTHLSKRNRNVHKWVRHTHIYIQRTIKNKFVVSERKNKRIRWLHSSRAVFYLSKCGTFCGSSCPGHVIFLSFFSHAGQEKFSS